MSEQPQIRRTVVNSSQLPKSNTLQATQLTSGYASNTHIQSSSGTGYQAYTTVTSSHLINGGRGQAQQGFVSVLPSRAMGGPEIQWSEYEDKLVVSGDTDFVALKTMKNAMLQLINEFKSRGNLAFEGEYRQNFQKRLILLQHEFQGLMRRVLNLKFMHPTDSKRNLDYSKFITEKENLIIDLERKIASLEERNRPNQEKIVQLQVQSEALRKELINKNSYIQELSRQVQKGFGFNNSAKNDAVLGHITSLQAQISALKAKNPNLSSLQSTVEGWISGLPHGSQLQRKLQSGTLRLKQDQLYSSMIQKLRYAQDLFAAQMSQLQRANPTLNLSSRSKILQILSAPNTRVGGVSASGVVQIEKEVRIEREVAVQDARTKALIVALGRYVKRLLQKYPKLREEMDVQLQEYISSEMIEVICDDDIDRIVSITKYVPQVVKVENVYTYSSEKTRKVEFYLRVLIKALLEELQKLKLKHGLALQIDEGVVGMIRAQILDLVDIDSILALFRSVPRVVEVPKYIEKVVDNIVTIPEKYVLRQKTTEVMPMAKTEVVHDQIGVPIRHDYPVQIVKQVPIKISQHIQKPVIHTEYRQVPVNQVIERTKAMEVPTKVEVVYEKDCPVEIPGQERIVVQNEVQVVQVPKTDVRYIQTVQEVLKPVEFVVQKLVQRLVQREKAVAVPVLQQKLVRQTVYEVIKQNNPILVTKYEIVPETHQKIVSFIQNRDNIVSVPQIVQKVVAVQRVVQLPPKLVQVKQQVMVKERVVQYVDVPRTEVVIKSEQVPVQVNLYHDRPLFVEVVKVEKEISNVPMMSEIVRQVHIPVEISKPCIVTQEVPVQINTTYPHFIKEEIPVYIKEESTVPIPYYYDRIRPEIQIVEKIIQKIVEVPKCVEVQRIVEKIVIVPRIIQKIVEVPQIIQRIVQKIVEVVKQLPPIERIIQRPCIVEVPVEVPVERIVYLTVERERIVKEEVLVKDFQTKTITVPQEIVNERVVVETRERPVEMFRDRVQYMYVDDVKVVKTDNVIVHPVEVPIPIILQKDLPIPIRYETVHVLPVPHLVEKVVPQIEERVRIEQVDVVHNIPYIQEEVKFVDRERVVVQTKYEEVQLIQEKIVEMVTTIEQIKEVPLIYEQLVPLVKEVAKVYEFDKDPKVIQTPPRVEIIQKIKPYIVNVNKYIERIVQKLVEVPYLLRETNLQQLIQQKTVLGPQRHTHDTEVVQISVQKQLYRQVQKKVIDTVHRISEVMKCATEIIQRDRDPVIITKDRIIQVPYVLQKIVEKIVVMPQVVEVLKYVHELIETDQINVLVDGDVEIGQYKEIAVVLEREMGAFLQELKRVRTSQPQLASRVEVIERYFSQFKRYIKQPKLFQRVREVKSAPEKEIVRVPHAKSAEEAREELAKVLLIEQLLAALRKIGAENRNVNLQNYLDKDVMGMFEVNFNGSVKKVNDSFKSQLKKFQQSIQSKFSKLDGWGVDHNVMLKSFIDERFQLANVIKRSKEINAQLTKENNDLREKLERERDVPVKIIQLLIQFNQFMPRILSVVDREKHKELYQSYNKLLKKFENFKKLYDSIIGDSQFGRTFEINEQFIQKYRGSSLREFVREIEILKDKLRNSSTRENEHSACDATINKLKAEIVRLQGLQRESNTRMYVSEREVQSPKQSINTHISPRGERKAYESQYIPGSQSDVEAYGQNFGEYVASDGNDAGLIGRRDNFQTYGSSVEQQNLDLAGSAATYRSNQVITSSHNIRTTTEGGNTLNIESSKKLYEGGNMASSAGSLGNLGLRYNNNLSIGDPNIVAYQNTTQTQQGGNAYGGNIKITTSRITAGQNSSQAEIKQSATYGAQGVPTTTRKYQPYHQRKYETGTQ